MTGGCLCLDSRGKPPTQLKHWCVWTPYGLGWPPSFECAFLVVGMATVRALSRAETGTHGVGAWQPRIRASIAADRHVLGFGHRFLVLPRLVRFGWHRRWKHHSATANPGLVLSSPMEAPFGACQRPFGAVNADGSTFRRLRHLKRVTASGALDSVLAKLGDHPVGLVASTVPEHLPSPDVVLFVLVAPENSALSGVPRR